MSEDNQSLASSRRGTFRTLGHGINIRARRRPSATADQLREKLRQAEDMLRIEHEARMKLAAQFDAACEGWETTKKELLHASRTDPKTGLWNMRGGVYALNALLDAVNALNASLLPDQHQHQVAIFFIDIDNFKKFNTDHGHLVADQVLAVVAKRLVKNCRSDQFGASIDDRSGHRISDAVVRYGGEEMLVFAATQNLSETLALCQRLLEAVREPICLPSGEVLHVTVSMGVTRRHPSQFGTIETFAVDPDKDGVLRTTIQHAESGEKMAKKSGKNRGEYVPPPAAWLRSVAPASKLPQFRTPDTADVPASNLIM